MWQAWIRERWLESKIVSVNMHPAQRPLWTGCMCTGALPRASVHRNVPQSMFWGLCSFTVFTLLSVSHQLISFSWLFFSFDLPMSAATARYHPTYRWIDSSGMNVPPVSLWNVPHAAVEPVPVEGGVRRVAFHSDVPIKLLHFLVAFRSKHFPMLDFLVFSAIFSLIGITANNMMTAIA